MIRNIFSISGLSFTDALADIWGQILILGISQVMKGTCNVEIFGNVCYRTMIVSTSQHEEGGNGHVQNAIHTSTV